MYETGDVTGGGSLFNQNEIYKEPVDAGTSINAEIPEELSPSELPVSDIIDDLSEKTSPQKDDMHINEALNSPSDKEVVKVIILYGDNSFDSYNPA